MKNSTPIHRIPASDLESRNAPTPKTARRALAMPMASTDAAGTWRHAMELLVLERRCPWCRNAISSPTANEHGLTWCCSGGCNP